MTIDDFRASLSESGPHPELSAALAGLWWDAKGDWNRAHECVQEDDGADGAWVHAYLHRREGDSANAHYWYSRAGRASSLETSAVEWMEIVRELLRAG